MKISKIIFTLRKSSGVPFFSLKIFIEKSVRAPLVTMRKNFLLKKKCVSIRTYYLPKLKKESVVVSKIFGKNRFFFLISTPCISEIKAFADKSYIANYHYFFM